MIVLHYQHYCCRMVFMSDYPWDRHRVVAELATIENKAKVNQHRSFFFFFHFHLLCIP